MGFTLDQVVPWGRSLEEYISMFDLAPTELKCHILDCAGGPASFNAEMTGQGHQVTSCDPIYQFSVAEIEQRIQNTWAILKDKVTAHQDEYVWDRFASPEALGAARLESMQQFLQDFPAGLEAKRYVAEELPILPFQDSQFDLALCSHFLFTYTDPLSEQFHLDSVRELCRVAPEVRLFPLLKVSGEPSPYLPTVIDEIQRLGYKVQIQPVPYEFQKGATQMLKIYRL